MVDRALRRVGPVVVVFGLLALITVIALVSGPSATRLPTMPGSAGTPAAPPPPAPAPEVSISGSPTPAPEAADVPAWVGTVAAVVIALLTAALLGALAYLFRRYVRIRVRARRPRPVVDLDTEPEPAPASAELHAAVVAGIEELADDSADPRRAVIGCWLRLEAASAAAGTERRPDDTPADLVGRLLTAHEVSADSLRVLAELYRQARYAPDVVDETMRARARATLTQLQTELGRPAVTP
jgi:hypothetical protein